MTHLPMGRLGHVLVLAVTLSLVLGWGTIAASPAQPLASGADLPATNRSSAFAKIDTDHDGLPDAVEYVLGLDPLTPDTDGDGIRDGAEDSDHDMLTNRFEVRWSRTEPRLRQRWHPGQHRGRRRRRSLGTGRAALQDRPPRSRHRQRRHQ